MRITELRTAEKVPFNLDGRKMLVDSRVEIVHLTLQPSEVLAKHTNPFDVAIYILEGEGMVETDENSVSVSPDMCIEVPSGANRGITNTSGGILRVLVVKIFER
ncbi:cupin domain-containing protein [Perlabentimonas gracilis]|uniref:cupin domain-containing protein n=1 Tax=Perlabentimonas gracilis TaxID=2715279 RepID=UPI00140DCC7D|nr:cupin domain-containing protein [Perlabentimonas gracilis]NHB68781.1 cupin domain-containing protein [Perlabentimonas gracilis]